MDRSVGVKKPKYSGDEGPSMKVLSGFNVKRQEFDPEYDNDAEKPLAEMEFKETDSETDRELKLRVLRIYLSRYALGLSCCQLRPQFICRIWFLCHCEKINIFIVYKQTSP